MFRDPVVIVDIETTGGSSRQNRIIEISILRVEGNTITQEFSTLINPGIRIPEFITGITGITNDDVKDAPYFEDIAPDISSICSGAHFMAHNVTFDFSFIKRQMEGSGHTFAPRLLCSVKLSRVLYKDFKGHSLQKIIQRHNIPVAARHRAYDDAKAVYDFMVIAHNQHGHEVFQETLYKQLKYKSLPTNFDESLLQGIKNVPGVYIFKDAQNTPVYIGKSVSLRNRILSHFTQSTTVSKELRISQNTHKLETIETESELEALLLESKLIKELPVYNYKLRRKKLQTILQKVKNIDGYYQINLVEGNTASVVDPETIFGVYDSRLKAKASLLNASATFDLCAKLLGLENTKGACFRYQLGKCKGACKGLEPPERYNFRLDLAFERSRVQTWKYKSPIVIKTSELTGILVDHWKVIGKVKHVDGLNEVEELNDSFSMDNYKIIRSYITRFPELVSLY